MNDYEFTLKFSLPDSESNPDRHVEALAEAGCDDALVEVAKATMELDSPSAFAAGVFILPRVPDDGPLIFGGESRCAMSSC